MEFTTQFGERLTRDITLIRGKLCEVLTNMAVAELPRRAHFAIDVKEKLAAGLDLAIKRAHRRPSIRRVMQHAVGDDQVKTVIGERRFHKVGLNDGAVRLIASILEGGEGCFGDV